MSPMDYIDQHYPVMYRYAVKLTRDVDKAHDVVVDTIFEVANRDLSEITYVKSYLNKCVYFCFLKRKRRSHITKVEIDPELHIAPANQETLVELSLLYDTMGPLMRETYYMDRSGEDIAKLRGISRQRVNVMLQKERKEWKI